MVVVTDQVQDAMDNHAIKFVLELGPIEGGVLPDGIHADEQVAADSVALAIVERDDVGEVIVLQVLHIHVQDVVVRTENDGNVTQAPDLAFGNQFEPAVGKPLLLEGKFRILGEIRDHNRIFVQIYK